MNFKINDPLPELMKIFLLIGAAKEARKQNITVEELLTKDGSINSTKT